MIVVSVEALGDGLALLLPLVVGGGGVAVLDWFDSMDTTGLGLDGVGELAEVSAELLLVVAVDSAWLE